MFNLEIKSMALINVAVSIGREYWRLEFNNGLVCYPVKNTWSKQVNVYVWIDGRLPGNN